MLALVGCGASDSADLQHWMAEQRRLVQPRIAPMAEPVPFQPQTYAQSQSVDPFGRDRLARPQVAGSAAVVRSGALVAPEQARAKQSLEAFPLDSMTMVGSLRRVGQPVALLRVNNLIYQVRTGDYLGQNFGRVQQISETSLALREIVQDASGEWVERAAILQLQGMSK